MDTLELLAARVVKNDDIYAHTPVDWERDYAFIKAATYVQAIEDLGGRFYEGGL